MCELRKFHQFFQYLLYLRFPDVLQRIQFSLTMMIKDDGDTWRSPIVSKKSRAPLSGQSNIAKSFLINSLRIPRRVHTDTCMPRYMRCSRIHIYKGRLYTRFPWGMVEVRSGRKRLLGEGNKVAHIGPRRYRENSPFVTRQTRRTRCMKM